MIKTHKVIAERVKELAAKFKRPIDYIEVGVYNGASAKAVLDTGDCNHATLIDNWCYEGASQAKSEEAVSQYKDKVRFIVGDSPKMLKHVAEMFDIGYVDGDHSEEGCIADMLSMLPLIRSDGVMFVDDLDHPLHPYLHRVVEKFAKQYGLNMMFHDSHTGLAELTR